MRYKNLFSIASGALMCVLVAFSASAQRPSGGGGGGGGSKPSGGGGGGGSVSSSARPSGGGGSVSVSRPSIGGGGGGISRPSVSGIRSGGAVSGNRAPAYVNRSGNVMRGNANGTGYTPRMGVSPQRGNYGLSPRVGVASNTRAALNAPRTYTQGGGNYRTMPRVGYNGYWANHGYNHYNHGYYGTYYSPRLGYRCSVLPYGYFPFYYGDYEYYYSAGLFYQYADDEYTVVEPPIGAEIKTLPDNAQSIVINGQQYYELNGVYYQPVTKDDGSVVYMVAGKDGQLTTGTSVQDQQDQGPQIGDIVNQLPQDCRKIKVNGQKLFVSPDGVYYQEIVDTAGNTTYKIVGLPSDEPDQNQ